MNKILVALALVFATSTSYAAVTPVTPKGDGIQTAKDPPKCVAGANQRNAAALRVVLHSMAFTVIQDGGDDVVTKKLTTVESQNVGLAINDLVSFSTGDAKCLEYTQAQAKAILKFSDLMVEYIEAKGLRQKMFMIVINNVGKENAAKAFGDAADIAKALMRHIGLTPPDNTL